MTGKFVMPAIDSFLLSIPYLSTALIPFVSVMFSLSNETDETTNFHSYSPAEYSGDSRSGSQSPSNLTEAIPAGSSGTSSSSSRPTKGSRKRQLPPIDLDGGSKSDELNNDSPTTSGSASVSDEESSSGHKSRFISTSNDPRDKRLRLTSFSSTSSTASLLSLGSDSGSQLSLASSDSYHDFAELDGYRSDSVCFGQTPVCLCNRNHNRCSWISERKAFATQKWHNSYC